MADNVDPNTPKSLTVDRLLYHGTVLRLAALGKAPKEIAATLDASVEKVKAVMASPLFKRELLALQESMTEGMLDVRKELANLAPIALKKKEEILLTTQSQELANKVAGDILDRAGHGAVMRQKVDVGGSVQVDHVHMTEAELRKMILGRVMRKKEEEMAKQKALEDANAIEIVIPEDKPETVKKDVIEGTIVE